MIDFTLINVSGWEGFIKLRLEVQLEFGLPCLSDILLIIETFKLGIIRDASSH